MDLREFPLLQRGWERLEGKVEGEIKVLLMVRNDQIEIR